MIKPIETSAVRILQGDAMFGPYLMLAGVALFLVFVILRSLATAWKPGATPRKRLVSIAAMFLLLTPVFLSVGLFWSISSLLVGL